MRSDHQWRNFDYKSMTRKQLLRHVMAYAEALHDLAGYAMKQEVEILSLRLRLARIDKVREFFHG